MARANEREQQVAADKGKELAAPVPDVRRAVRPAAKAKARSVPASPPAKGRAKKDPAPATVEAPRASARPGVLRRPGTQALALICAPSRKGDGWRHGWLGDTGTGKTWASRKLVELGGQLVLVHDDSKAAPEYPQIRYERTPAELLARPAEETQDLSAVAFRGDPYAGIVCEVDEVAGLALQFARARIPTRLCIDELERAVTDGGQKLTSANLRACFVQGRSMGLSVNWCTQTPQRVPIEVATQSSSIGIFRLGPRALNYLDERLYFDADMLAVVPNLQVGDFVLHRPGFPWDRTVYRF